MSKKVLYFINQPLDERNYYRFGFENWLKNDYDVECWIFGNYKFNYKDYEKLKSINKLFLVFNFSFKQLFIFLLKRKLKNFYIVDYSGSFILPLFILKILCLGGGQKVLLDVNSNPNKLNFRKHQKIYFKNLIYKIMNYCFYNLFFVYPHYVFLSGKVSKENFKKNKKSKIFEINNLDYDEYLKLSNNIVKSDYILFLDQAYPNHPDFKRYKLSFVVNEQKYWNSIFKFLDNLSLKYKLPVKVALHPKNIKIDNKIMVKYDTHLNNTAKLVKDSSLVIAHDSSSVQYAVLWQKPIIFISTDELERSKEHFNYICNYANALNKKVVNIDKNIDFIDESFLNIDKKIYKLYEENYIKSYDMPVSYWDKVISTLEMNKF